MGFVFVCGLGLGLGGGVVVFGDLAQVITAASGLFLWLGC